MWPATRSGRRPRRSASRPSSCRGPGRCSPIEGTGHEGGEVARVDRGGAPAEGARAQRRNLQSALPALDGDGQESLAAGAGAEGPGAGPDGAPREEGRHPWVSGKTVRAWWSRTRCRRRGSSRSSACSGIRMSKKLKAHDENNERRVGDRVLIEETRPMSKEKRWRIRKVLTRVS